MIVKEYIKDFEKMGLGMFVHFGLYAYWGRGEWHRFADHIPLDEYNKALAEFKVEPDWATELVKTAKDAGCKYITLTTRHHDGFSLYDTCGLNEYDAPHSAAGRDLVKEFVDACNAEGIKPFFYHTLVDWYNTEPDFKKYLQYLRASVELLCTRYGEIGGLWFDGMCFHWDRDWEEDALYGMIRKYQPNAMIINNTGMEDRGKRGHIEIDSLTFELDIPPATDNEDQPKYLAAEMCGVLGSAYWGYTPEDIDCKSMRQILSDFLTCRRHKANYLMNVGPMVTGKLSGMDKGYFEKIGIWMRYNEEAVRDVDYVECNVNVPDDFVVYNNENGNYYFFDYRSGNNENIEFTFDKEIESMMYLDGEEEIKFEQKDGKVYFTTNKSRHGTSIVIRVVRIKTK